MKITALKIGYLGSLLIGLALLSAKDYYQGHQAILEAVAIIGTILLIGSILVL